VPYAIALVRIVAGLLFWQHGLEKLFGFAGARPEPTLWAVRGVGGILETVGGPLIALGLIHASDRIHPQRRNGCRLLSELGAAWFFSRSPTAAKRRRSSASCISGCAPPAPEHGAWMASCVGIVARHFNCGSEQWQPYARSLLRIIVGFLLTLHGCRKLFGVLVSVAGRRNAPPLAIDALPSFTGYIDLVAGVLLMLGLFVRQTAVVVATEALLAYALFAQPRTLWPIRNGGNEALLYAVLGVLFVVAGARAWSVDARLDKSPGEIDLHNYSERRRLRA
jgi:putative oxidoreductase